MQYCAQCGAELKEDTKFCPYCGISTPLATQEEIRRAKTRNEENRMVGVTNLLVIPFSVRCVTDCEL